MIEGPPKGEVSPKAAAVPALKRLKDTVEGLGQRLWRLIVPGQRQVDLFLWNLRVASRVLWVLLAGLGAYTIADLFLARPPTPANPPAASSANGTSGAGSGPETLPPLLKPLSEYLAALTQRNPFTGRAGGGAVEPQQASQTARHQLETLAGGLTVVGIDRGPHPVALIEQKEPQRTYVVKVGDDVNGLHVTRIGQEGVVVSYEGEEILLQ